jgi:hypothetical protein
MQKLVTKRSTRSMKYRGQSNKATGIEGTDSKRYLEEQRQHKFRKGG